MVVLLLVTLISLGGWVSMYRGLTPSSIQTEAAKLQQKLYVLKHLAAAKGSAVQMVLQQDGSVWRGSFSQKGIRPFFLKGCSIRWNGLKVHSITFLGQPGGTLFPSGVISVDHGKESLSIDIS